MYGVLLALIFFLPYSLALIAVCQGMMIAAWISKRFLLWKTPLRQGCPQGFNFISCGMGWALIAIALLIVLTIPFSHYPALSLRKFFTRFLQQIFLMYWVTELVSSRKRLYGVLAMLLLTLFLVTVNVMIQYAWGESFFHHTSLIFGRVTGPMKHPNDLGTLLVTVLPVVLVLVIVSRVWIPLLAGPLKPPGQGKMPWAGMAAISILFLLLVNALGLTDSRGAWVSFAVSMMTLGVLLKSRNLIIFIILMLVMFFWVYGMHCLSTRLDIYHVPMLHGPKMHPTLFNPWGLPASFNALDLFWEPGGREFYWKTALGVIKHYPWFGCGYSAYVQTLKDLHVGHTEYPHNSLLHITAELGLAGLILYGWFFVALYLKIKNVLREISREHDLFLIGIGISSGILAWLVHSLLDTPWSSLQLGLLWWLFIGILLSLGFVSANHKTPPVMSG
jgi:O-Antigen ligase